MHVLLVPFGSHGDVHPFVGLGLALARRGHRVELATNGHFGPLAQRAGLAFTEIGTDDEYRGILENPDLWHPRRAFSLLSGAIAKILKRQYDLLSSRLQPGQSVVVHGSLALAPHLLREAQGIPTATVHLQPGVLRSAHTPPRYPGLAMKSWWPLALKRGLYAFMDKKVIDPALAPAVNSQREAIGLPPIKGILAGALHSPNLTLGLFPSWYASPQPDWPSSLELTGFPLYDESGHHKIDPDLEAFLQSGPPPVVFTPGSANLHARAFFNTALEACRRSGRRALFLTRYSDQIPHPLPDFARHRPYLPFSAILPRASAIVHHGGIGTCAQAFAAGIPQLLMTLAHDQFDNADRLARLGVGRSRIPSRFTPRNVARDLHFLLDNPAVASNARALADRVRQDPNLDATAARIEARLTPLLRA